MCGAILTQAYLFDLVGLVLMSTLIVALAVSETVEVLGDSVTGNDVFGGGGGSSCGCTFVRSTLCIHVCPFLGG